jgi:hypothetical protein
MKLQEYITENKLVDVYYRMSGKDLTTIKKIVRELETALKDGDEIKARSAARTIQSSATRIHDNMMEVWKNQ